MVVGSFHLDFFGVGGSVIQGSYINQRELANVGRLWTSNVNRFDNDEPLDAVVPNSGDGGVGFGERDSLIRGDGPAPDDLKLDGLSVDVFFMYMK